MIHGPPGTGKTTVIAALVHSLVAQKKKVLVVAHTNVATNQLTLKIASTGIRPVRVFAQVGLKPDPAVACFASTDEDSLFQAMVVVTTTGCIGGARFRRLKFYRVIVDEASQCLDPELLQAVVYGCKQLVLVGDHKQISPMVTNPASRHLRFDTPLMLRTVLNGKRPAILNMQYRMHPAIAAFASRTFYGGLLHDGAVERPVPKVGLAWPNPAVPIVFWNIESVEEYAGSGTSFVNRGEATAIGHLLRCFAGSGVDPDGVAVITPYLGQVSYLYDALPALSDPAFVSKVEIDTVDAFQGREKDFVIFGCVRANGQREIGFLTDKRRMNVALTRAKFGMIIVGTAAVFANNDTWASFIEYCQSLDAFVEGPVDNWRPATFEREESDENASDHDEGLA
jgi:regulator of nonsense transcripts 1